MKLVSINHLATLAIATLLLLGGTIATGNSAQAVEEDVPLTQTITIDSKSLGEQRRVLVSLPRSYEYSPDTRFPVIFILDADTEFQHANALVRYLAENAALAPDLIVVGIAQVRRGDELRPTNPSSGEVNPREAQFRKFLTDELSPRIDSQFRTHPYRIIFGHSLAGLFVLNTLGQSPQSFDAYIASSPALWWQEGKMVQELARTYENLDAGKQALVMTTEGIPQDANSEVLEFVRLLQDRRPTDLAILHRLFDSERHSTVAPVSLYWSVKSTFDGWRPDASIFRQGLPALLAHYNGLSERYGWTIEIPSDSLSSLVFDFARRNAPGDAEKVREIVNYAVFDRSQSPSEYLEMISVLQLQGLPAAADVVRDALCSATQSLQGCVQQ